MPSSLIGWILMHVDGYLLATTIVAFILAELMFLGRPRTLRGEAAPAILLVLLLSLLAILIVPKPSIGIGVYQAILYNDAGRFNMVVECEGSGNPLYEPRIVIRRVVVNNETYPITALKIAPRNALTPEGLVLRPGDSATIEAPLPEGGDWVTVLLLGEKHTGLGRPSGEIVLFRFPLPLSKPTASRG